MNVADMLGALRRRWYVLVAGLIVAGLAAYGAWTVVKVEYTRTATQLMLPGPGTIPEDANPFLFVGGLSQAADVLVRKMGSPDVLGPVEREFDGVQIVVTRDPLSSGPVLLTSVTSQSDDDAAAAVQELVQLTESTLKDIQRVENIPTSDRITLVTLTTDDEGAVEQKTRLIAAGAAAAGIAALTLLLVALIDGLARARAQRPWNSGARRSRDARTPSWRSSVASVTGCASASQSMHDSKSACPPSRSATFVRRLAIGAVAAMPLAISRTDSSNSPSGVTWETSPMRNASSAPIMRPVRSRSRAWASPTTWGSV